MREACVSDDRAKMEMRMNFNRGKGRIINFP